MSCDPTKSAILPFQDLPRRKSKRPLNPGRSPLRERTRSFFATCVPVKPFWRLFTPYLRSSTTALGLPPPPQRKQRQRRWMLRDYRQRAKPLRKHVVGVGSTFRLDSKGKQQFDLVHDALRHVFFQGRCLPLLAYTVLRSVERRLLSVSSTQGACVARHHQLSSLPPSERWLHGSHCHAMHTLGLLACCPISSFPVVFACFVCEKLCENPTDERSVPCIVSLVPDRRLVSCACARACVRAWAMNELPPVQFSMAALLYLPAVADNTVYGNGNHGEPPPHSRRRYLNNI